MDWGGIPSDRVVAVLAHLDTGRVQIGSGYLVAEQLVLTARHCTMDTRTERQALWLQITRRSDGAEASARPIAVASDFAVLTAPLNTTWVMPIASEPPRFGKVNRDRSRLLHDCQAVGFPLWQFDPREQQRNAAELHGTIRVTEDVESGLMVMRDPLLSDVAIPDTVYREDQEQRSPWGGLSGALVFYQGMAVGVVIEHHPRQGRAAITIEPVERLTVSPTDENSDLIALATALGLPPADKLPLVDGLPLAGLVDVLIHGRLPRVSQLDPYTLGATPSAYGNADTYQQHDTYVVRNKDAQLAGSLLPGRLVLLIGPTKAGKTRTTFEALRRHDRWHDALLAAPEPDSLEQLDGHSALGTTDPLVIWLDSLHRFLPPTGKLTQSTISRLLDRPGPTILLGTLRSEQRERLREPEGELAREVQMVLEQATSIEFRSTKDELSEQARAVTAYPGLDLRKDGLAEMLAGAPELLRQYRDAIAANPLLHAIVQICIDWTRCGLVRPLPEQELVAVARERLEANRPDLDLSSENLGSALRRARKGIAGGGQVALLCTYSLPGRSRRHFRTARLPGRSRGYEAFDYLVAADDGQVDESARQVDETTWQRFLSHATDEDALYIGVAGLQRGNTPVAIAAFRCAAEAGRSDAQYNLGMILATILDPPDLVGARFWWTRAAATRHIDVQRAAQFAMGTLLAGQLDPPDLAGAMAWFTKAAEAGDTRAQFNLALLLTDSLDPPDLAKARVWYTKAADAGDIGAQFNLALLELKLDPPDIAGARTWYTKAAEAGHTEAQFNLALLLTDSLHPPDLAGARAWYTKAAEAGQSDAQNNLGWLLEHKLDPPDLAGARAWYTKAAQAGHARAQFNLGWLLGEKLDPPDLAGAQTWLTRPPTPMRSRSST